MLEVVQKNNAQERVTGGQAFAMKIAKF